MYEVSLFAETAVARPPLERVIREALGIPAQYVDNEHDVPSAVVQLVANELNDDLGALQPQGLERWKTASLGYRAEHDSFIDSQRALETARLVVFLAHVVSKTPSYRR